MPGRHDFPYGTGHGLSAKSRTEFRHELEPLKPVWVMLGVSGITIKGASGCGGGGSHGDERKGTGATIIRGCVRWTHKYPLGRVLCIGREYEAADKLIMMRVPLGTSLQRLCPQQAAHDGPSTSQIPRRCLQYPNLMCGVVGISHDWRG